MRFHIYDASSRYEGWPYSGTLSEDRPAEFDTMSEAVDAKLRMTLMKPIGWAILDTKTGAEIH